MTVEIFDYTEKEYDGMLRLYKAEKITLPEWREYCYEWLRVSIKMNQKVLENLK